MAASESPSHRPALCRLAKDNSRQLLPGCPSTDVTGQNKRKSRLIEPGRRSAGIPGSHMDRMFVGSKSVRCVTDYLLRSATIRLHVPASARTPTDSDASETVTNGGNTKNIIEKTSARRTSGHGCGQKECSQSPAKARFPEGRPGAVQTRIGSLSKESGIPWARVTVSAQVSACAVGPAESCADDRLHGRHVSLLSLYFSLLCFAGS
jgi:hypothetical protein